MIERMTEAEIAELNVRRINRDGTAEVLCTKAFYEITALRAENERLLAANKDSMLHFDALKADYEKMRAAGRALVAFYEGPLEAKTDVFHQLIVRLNAALSPAVREGK